MRRVRRAAVRGPGWHPGRNGRSAVPGSPCSLFELRIGVRGSEGWTALAGKPEGRRCGAARGHDGEHPAGDHRDLTDSPGRETDEELVGAAEGDLGAGSGLPDGVATAVRDGLRDGVLLDHDAAEPG